MKMTSPTEVLTLTSCKPLSDIRFLASLRNISHCISA